MTIFFFSIFFISTIAYGQASDFRWLDPKKDEKLFSSIEKEFSPELKLEGFTEKFSSQVFRIGLFQNNALVALKFDYFRDSEEKPDYYGVLFYNYNLENKKKSNIIVQAGGVNVIIKNMVRFEYGPMPDIPFTYWTCKNCEAEFLLSSLQYDPKLQQWKIRPWGKLDSILIGSDDQLGDYIYSYTCIYKIQDINGDGFEDVATWCRTTSRDYFKNKAGPIENNTLVYSIVKGVPIDRKIESEPELSKIHAILCEGSKSPLCKKR